MKHIAKHITSFIRWGIGGLSLLMALIALLAGELISGSFLVAFGLLVTPLSSKYLFDRLKWQIPSWAKVVLGFVFLIGFALTTSSKPSIAAKSPTNESPAAIEVVYVAGKTVKLYHNNVDLGEKQTDKNRKAVYEDVELSEGDNTFRAEVIGEDTSINRVIVYDTIPPDKPAVNLASEVRDKNLLVQGTSEPNTTIKILFNGSVERIVKTNSKGEFSTKYVLGNPENSFEFEAIDSAGNSSGLTDKILVTYIDTKKLADEEKKAQQQEAKVQKEQEAQAVAEAEEKARQEEERKRIEEEEARKAQAEEDKLDTLASQYCAEREESSRYYPIPDKTTDENGDLKYEQKDNKKKGYNLTQNDCRTIIDYITWFNNEYGIVESIDIQKVIERKFWIGMNIGELTSSVGWPNNINTTNYGSGKVEQWIYHKDSHGISAYYFYVESGKVTSYQDF